MSNLANAYLLELAGHREIAGKCRACKEGCRAYRQEGAGWAYLARECPRKTKKG